MKASEVIKLLEKCIKDYGDGEVLVRDKFGSMGEAIQVESETCNWDDHIISIECKS